MKRLLPVAIIALGIIGCSKSDDPKDAEVYYQNIEDIILSPADSTYIHPSGLCNKPLPSPTVNEVSAEVDVDNDGENDFSITYRTSYEEISVSSPCANYGSKITIKGLRSECQVAENQNYSNNIIVYEFNDTVRFSDEFADFGTIFNDATLGYSNFTDFNGSNPYGMPTASKYIGVKIGNSIGWIQAELCKESYTFVIQQLAYSMNLEKLAAGYVDPNEECQDCNIAYKPNIYIYPEKTINLNVSLDFPQGGKVIASIPDYGNGWSITVDTAGTIDGGYSYLFYESEQPDVWQKHEGWIVPKEELESFFTGNLEQYGFTGQEIDDFIEYWIPRLQSSKFYKIFPQTKNDIDPVISLQVSQQPDNILRLFYLIGEASNGNEAITPPAPISQFAREGYFITEWGVILE